MISQTDQPGQDGIFADGVLTVAEAARLLRLGRSSVYGLMDAGRLPYCKFGRSRRIPRRAVINYMRENLVGTEAGL